MNNVETIEHMWKVASNNPHHDSNWHDPVVIEFAKLVARHELEVCATFIEKLNLTGYKELAELIRARGKE